MLNFTKWSVAVLVLTASAAWAQSREAGATCTDDQLRQDPATTIVPCSSELAKYNLTNERRIEAFYIRGRAYHRIKQLEKAASDYDAALSIAPSSDILVDRANAAFNVGEYQLSFSYIDQALQLDPKNARALRQLASMLSDIGDTANALKFYTAALEADPLEPFALLFRSQAYENMGRIGDALADADRLIAVPRTKLAATWYSDTRRRDFHTVALLHRADLLVAQGQIEAAEKDFAAAVTHEPASNARLERGSFLLRVDRDQEAAADLQEAVRLEPESDRAHYLLALIRMREKRYDEALDLFGTALRLNPKNGLAYFMQARVYRHFGRTDDAVESFETAIAVRPKTLDDALPAMRVAGYLSSLERPRQMTKKLKDAIRACMSDPECN